MLPIKLEYHTKLLPDCILKTESPKDYKKNLPWMNALKKFYIGDNLWSSTPKKDDIIIFYRTKDNLNLPASYRSVLTGLGIILSKEKVNHSNIENKLSRSALSKDEIKNFKNPEALEFLFLSNFEKRPTLQFLRNNNLFTSPDEWGPRGLYPISENLSFKILNETKFNII